MAEEVMTLGRRELDAAGCETPGCEHDHSVLYLHPRCGHDGGLAVRYVKATGCLELSCHWCDREITKVRVGGDS